MPHPTLHHTLCRLLLGAGLSCCGLNPQAHAQTTQSVPRAALVHGVLFDANGNTIAGATLYLGTQSIQTNAHGGFLVRIPPGKHPLSVTLKGQPTAQLKPLELHPGQSVELILTAQNSGQITLHAEGLENQHHVPLQAVKTSPERAKSPPGILRGQVRHADKNRPIKGAKVFIRGLSREVTTNNAGEFTLNLPQGKYDLSIIHPDFAPLSQTGIELTPDAPTTLTFQMLSASFELEPLVMYLPRLDGSTAALLEQRQKANTMNEVLGAEQFSKSGDASAASALKRVTGLTLVGGKFVYIRGLGGRYSQTLLNGSSLPSTEPDKRAVPLDMFPSSQLESITVQKTYSPNMPASFGGGVVQMTTRKIPTEFQASLGLGMSYRHGTTFQDTLNYQGGSLDWLGIDDGTRSLPDEVRQASEKREIRRANRQRLEELGESMPNNWGLEEQTLPPGLSLEGNIGDRFSLLGKDAGVQLGLTYQNGWQITQMDQQRFTVVGPGSELSMPEDRAFEFLTNEILLSLMLTGGVTLSDSSSLAITSILTRVTDNDRVFYEGLSLEERASLRGSRGRWRERQLLIEQIEGSHEALVWDLDAKWNYTFSQAAMLEPDRRDIQQIQRDGVFLLSRLADGHSILHSELTDNNHDLSLHLKTPLSWLNKADASLSFGPQLVIRSREVDTRRYKYQRIEKLPDDVRARRPDQVFTPEFIDPDQLVFDDITRGTDNYTGYQFLGGLYAMVDWNLGSNFVVQVGARGEYSSQEVVTFDPNDPTKKERAELPHFALFPSLNGTWKITDTMQVRAALSQTTSRPNFRELSPAQFIPAGGGLQIEGNPELEPASITHLDLRWEWYTGVGESLSAGVFAKRFSNPIEPTYIPGATTRQTFINIDKGENVGVEVEARKSLQVVHPVLEDLFIAGNAAYVLSKVTIDDPKSTLTSKERPLVGQSPFMLNAQLEYDNKGLGLTTSLLLNYVGPRINTLGALQLPDTYETPRTQLDLVVSQTVGGWRIGASAKNLLDQSLTLTQGDKVFREYRPIGRAFSMGASYSF